MIRTLIFFGLLFSFNAHCIPEKDYKNTFESKVLPFYLQTAIHQYFNGKDGVKIHFVEFSQEKEKGAIALLPGQSEPAIKYAEAAYDLYQAGYSVYVLDHRGQGLSSRLLADPQKSHVGDFMDYVADAETFIKDHFAKKLHVKKFLLTHSMGGAVGAFVLKNNPLFFDAAVLCAPMFSIQTKPYPQFLAKVVAGILKQENYAPGRGPLNPDAAFTGNTLTGSEPRFRENHDLMKLYPENMVGGPTVHWVSTSLSATKKIRAFKRETFTIPVLVLQAGQDEWVKNSGEKLVCEKNKSCRIAIYPTAKHEILTEVDSIRDNAFDLIIKQFQ